MPNPSVTIVIPVYNGEKTVSMALNRAFNQTYKHVDVVIVVDDGSTDDTASVAGSFCAEGNVKYIYQDNAGPAAARNRGVKEAASELIFFTDADCIPEPDWIEKAIVHFQEQDVAVVAGSYCIANSESLLARCIHGEILFRHRYLMPEYPRVFGSYNFGVRKNIFEKNGGFNTKYRYASGEDNDLSYRILRAGYKIYFEKGALVCHFHTTELRKYLSEQFRHGFWRVQMYLDHPLMSGGDNYTFWKDIIEVPIAFFVSLTPVLAVFFRSALIFSGLIPAVVLFFVELFFCFLIRKKILEAGFGILEIFFMSTVMFLRAFARMSGFLTGISLTILKKI